MKGFTKCRTLSEATEMLGVHENTVRRWGDEGTLRMVRTPGGHRRFPLSGVEEMLGGPKAPLEDESTEVRAAIYCRVSSHDQKQKGALEQEAFPTWLLGYSVPRRGELLGARLC